MAGRARAGKCVHACAVLSHTKLTCSSAIRSEGFTEWNAPEQMNRMWSVSTLPCLVWTVEPVAVCVCGRERVCVLCAKKGETW